ncbi:creatininase family protein [Sphingosinicella rhizophila]|uniref:Creatininase family protein n=1 Tax=Sphingosinicella rhizophila TaxID=3050082 RepID=A0ABU3Q5L7_9SPHN|nr:creatininase family protein [Sphingosinicella sp. GR2756]MDT9598701.1 creatininase family protein [Sphingosinicella sp. GR2756]
MILSFSTCVEVEAHLRSGSRTIVIPIGSTEQHGPTGLLGTDWMCPEIIAARAETQSNQVLIGPTFNVGMAQHHLAFPGTISLRPSTMMLVLKDWISSFCAQGFQTIYFLNGHGGNIPTIEAAFSEFYAEASYEKRRSSLILILRNWWQLAGVEELARRQFPHGHGSHAEPSEISVTQAAYPASIKTAHCHPPIAPSGPVRDALDFKARHPDGRMGSDPLQADPRHGEDLIALAAQGLLAELAALEAGHDQLG